MIDAERDPEKVHEALGAAIADVPQYLDGVRRFLDAAAAADESAR